MSEQEASTSKPEEQEIQAAEQIPSEEPQAATAIDEGEKPSGEESETLPKDDPATEPAVEEPTAAGKDEEEEEPEEEEPDDGVPIVLVTGASGFVATHLIKMLLEQGRYHVRGTVRSKKKQEKVQYSMIRIDVYVYARVHYMICRYWPPPPPPPLPSQVCILDYLFQQ